MAFCTLHSSQVDLLNCWFSSKRFGSCEHQWNSCDSRHLLKNQQIRRKLSKFQTKPTNIEWQHHSQTKRVGENRHHEDVYVLFVLWEPPLPLCFRGSLWILTWFIPLTPIQWRVLPNSAPNPSSRSIELRNPRVNLYIGGNSVLGLNLVATMRGRHNTEEKDSSSHRSSMGVVQT